MTTKGSCCRTEETCERKACLMTIQRILCRIMGYDKYVKGKDLLIADALSRSQTTNQKRSKIEQEIETTRLVHEDQSL